MGHNSWKPSLATLVRFAVSSAGFHVTRREQFVLRTNISPKHLPLSLPPSPGQGCPGCSFLAKGSVLGCTRCPGFRAQALRLEGLLVAQSLSSSCTPRFRLHQTHISTYLYFFNVLRFSWHYPSTGCGADKESSGWSDSGKILLGSHQL